MSNNFNQVGMKTMTKIIPYLTTLKKLNISSDSSKKIPKSFFFEKPKDKKLNEEETKQLLYSLERNFSLIEFQATNGTNSIEDSKRNYFIDQIMVRNQMKPWGLRNNVQKKLGDVKFFF